MKTDNGKDASCSSAKLNINSGEFDAESYVRNLLHEKGIDDLVAVEEDMVKNVRWLDAEMRELVYENYNKFLMATQAVRNMQDRLASMRTEVSALSKKMVGISDLSDNITEKLLPHHKQIKELTEAKRLSEERIKRKNNEKDDSDQLTTTIDGDGTDGIIQKADIINKAVEVEE